jgi:ribosomal subunit interface protein
VEKHALHDTEHKGKESHIAELTALCTDKQVIRVSHECEDMYVSLDLLADQLARKLRKHKEKLSQRKQESLPTSDVFVAEDPEPDGVDAE